MNMTETLETPVTPEVPVTPVVPEAPVPPVEPEKELMIPKTRFDEVNNKHKDMVGKLATLEASKLAMEKELADMKLASEGSQTSITEATDKLKAEELKYSTLMESTIASKMATIPEDMQDLVPDGLTVEQKIAWIGKAEEKGLFKKQVKANIGDALNHSSNTSQSEKLQKMNPFQALVSFYSGSK
jgi:hypothetical protein